MSNAKSELESLNADLDALKTARARHAEAKAEQEKMLAEFQASEKWQNLSIERAFVNTEIEDLECTIRTTAIELHNASMELPARIQIKNFTVVTIMDELKAKDWCIAHFTPALKLDSKVFEKAAKDGNIPTELAEVTKEARAQIATKL